MFHTEKAKQVTIDPKLHKVIKDYAKKNGLVIHAATNDIIESGLRVKRLLPSTTEQSTEPQQ